MAVTGARHAVVMAAHDAAIAERARQQLGLITHRQLGDVGVAPSTITDWVADGRLEVVHPSVFRVAGANAPWRATVLAACLAGGPGAVASHRAAAELHGLPVPAAPVEITARRSRHAFSSGVVLHRPVRLDPLDVTAVAGVPSTSVARTLLDLGAVVHRGRVQEAVDAALRDGRVSADELAARLEALAVRGRPGVTALRAALADGGGGPVPESVLERRFLQVIADLAIPTPVRQFDVRVGGRFLARLDFAWPEHRIGAEVDGHGSHATRRQRAHDLERRNRLAEAGWQLRVFTYEQVAHEADLVRHTMLLVLGASRTA